MKTFIYEIADHSLHLAKTEVSQGDGIHLIFPEIPEGVCHLGDESAPIKNGCAAFAQKQRRRGAYGVSVRTAENSLMGDALMFSEGEWRGESDEKMCRTMLEIARLKDLTCELSHRIKQLSDAVFRTVIF